ncbi:Uncharacterized protein APZ42_002200 [Daphnia magna]|uniref:Uncharacterized protein n=1 Tax=Daphnia magna TaxID=35525 RepID=A0A164IFP6_9CRUS|nr:Uncharacterized protein APZ42_002200 [Daphnia magna]
MADLEHPQEHPQLSQPPASAAPSLHSAVDSDHIVYPVTDYPQPTLFALGPDPDSSAVLTLTGSDTPLHATSPSTLTFVVDTASKLNIIPKSVAQSMNLIWDPSRATTMRTSSGQITSTMGKISDVAITLCANNPAKRCSVMVDLDVVDCGNASFDVLLGVQWITAIGAEISTRSPSSLTYYTQHPRLRVYEGPVTIPLITTAE